MLVKYFGKNTKVVVKSYGQIEEISIYDLTFSEGNPAFKLGYICQNKTNLVTGWTTSRIFEDKIDFAEAVMEAHHIFQENFTAKELVLLGYK